MKQNAGLNVVTFATWRYEGGRRRLLRSIERHSPAHCWNFSDNGFRRTDLYRRLPEIARAPRGAGYWLWKPHYILQVLQQVQDGDYVLYLDAGMELRSDVSRLLKLADNEPGVALFKVHGRLNRHWTKRDCLILMEADSEAYLNVEQAMGGIVLIRKNPRSEQFVREWLVYASDTRVLTDVDNTCGSPNHDGFVEHRHDQSILTNLSVRFGIPVFTDPTQFGDAYRESAIKGVDDYPSLFDLHRERAPSWQTALKLLRTDRARFMLAASRHLARIARSAVP